MRSLLLGVVIAIVGCSGSSKGMIDGGGGDDGGGDAGCTCEVAAGVCLDANTLESSRVTGGMCEDNSCTYEKSISPCPFGCADGACQPQACTPSCPTATCVDDGCGGTCGACASGTNFPGVTATNLGIADDAVVAPDGIHVVTGRALEPLPANCGFNPPKVGRLDVWTIPASGAATHVTIGAHVPLWTVRFTTDGYMLYDDNVDPCKGRGELWIAKADGSEPRRIAAGVSIGSQIVNGVVFFDVADPADPDPSDFDGFVYAAKLPDGAPRQLAKLRFNSIYVVSPTGDRLWLNYSSTKRDLTIHRIDGTATPIVSGTAQMAGFPLWSPDGAKLAYSMPATQLGLATLRVVDADGTNDVLLDNECRCDLGDAVAWSSTGARIAWIERPPTFGLDAHVHAFSGGNADVVLTGVVSPTTGGSVFRLTFSNDDARLYAAAGSDQNGWKLMSGDVTTAGAMTPLVPVLTPDGFRFRDAWNETPTGSVLAANAGGSTQVTTFGGATQSITGSAFEQAQLEPVAANPRWLIHHANTLSIFPTAGTGVGTPLIGYQWTDALSSWAFSNKVPFVYGWAGTTALYPSAVGSSMNKVTQDLLAISLTSSGRLGSLVTHYRLSAQPARVYFTTSANGLFWLPRP